MKFFVDTADVAEIKEAAAIGLARRRDHQPVAGRQGEAQLQRGLAEICES